MQAFGKDYTEQYCWFQSLELDPSPDGGPFVVPRGPEVGTVTAQLMLRDPGASALLMQLSLSIVLCPGQCHGVTGGLAGSARDGREDGPAGRVGMDREKVACVLAVTS